MPPASQYPKRATISDASNPPEALPQTFVISTLPPPAPSSRVRASAAPTSIERVSSRPPPLPVADPAHATAEPLASAAMAWDAPTTDRAALKEERAATGSDFRPWPRWASWLGLKSQLVLAKLRGFEKRRQLLKPALIAVVAATLGWGVGAKPWARRPAIAHSSFQVQAKAGRGVHGHTVAALPTGPVPGARPAVPIDIGKPRARPPQQQPKAALAPKQHAKLPSRGKARDSYSKAAAGLGVRRTAPAQGSKARAHGSGQ